MSSMAMCEGRQRMEIWAGSSTETPSTRRCGVHGGAHSDQPIVDKENIDPSGPFNRRYHSSIHSWPSRYPLQDITVLMHFLQGMRLDVDSFATTYSGMSTIAEAGKRRSALPVPRSQNSKNNAKSSSSLRMNFR